jgi:hypothetical protein
VILGYILKNDFNFLYIIEKYADLDEIKSLKHQKKEVKKRTAPPRRKFVVLSSSHHQQIYQDRKNIHKPPHCDRHSDTWERNSSQFCR